MAEAVEVLATAPFQYFTDHRYPELAETVSGGRRHEFSSFGWAPDDVPDPQSVATFQASKLDWSERDRAPHAGLLDWHRQLLELRRCTPDLRDPRLDRVEADEAAGTLVVRRGAVTVLVNLGEQQHLFELEGEATVLARSDDRTGVEHRRVVVPPDAVAIVEVARG
jgi:maltooligosyltrehalose trehalohydrolase